MRLTDPTRTGERNEQESRRDGGAGRDPRPPRETDASPRLRDASLAWSRHALLEQRPAVRHTAAGCSAVAAPRKRAADPGRTAPAAHSSAFLNAIVGSAAWHPKQSIVTETYSWQLAQNWPGASIRTHRPASSFAAWQSMHPTRL